MTSPQRIGKYEVRTLLGEGAMGTVYLCEHTVLGRKVAVKVLKPSFTHDRDLVSRFVNEARAATAIGHPAIVDVLDIELPDDGPPYMVMEYLRGETLSARIKRSGRVAVREAVAITLQVASALGAAHDKGIVHRDLKPENLFLVPDPLGPVPEKVKVLDFGVAKLRGRPGAGTAEGMQIGTPLYMSPEQWRGVSEEVDHRADIYALGVVLYEMLCGQPPFVGRVDEIVAMHREQAPLPPSTRNRAISPGIERTILCALAKDPADRFASMRELRQALGDPQALPRPALRASTPQGVTPLPATMHLTDTALAQATAPPPDQQAGDTRLLPDGGATSGEPTANGSIEMTPRSLPPRPPARRGRWLLVAAVAIGGVALLGGVALRLDRLHGTDPTTPAPDAPTAPSPPPTAATPPAAAAIEKADQPTGAAGHMPPFPDHERKGKRPIHRSARGKGPAGQSPRPKDDKAPLNVPKW
jgi:serine/threonine protein kinase